MCEIGPSFILDSACSASVYAIDCAVKAIRNGDCDGALVGASNLCIQSPSEYYKMGVLSDTGICRPFDADGNLNIYELIMYIYENDIRY